MMSQQDRIYSEQEIGALIKRATELHEESAGRSGRGLSLNEIERIADELGVPSDFVKMAALELGDSHESNRSGFWGGPFILENNGVVDRPLTKKQWERVVLELQRLTGNSGEIQEIGDSLEWSRKVEDGVLIEKTQVILSPEADQTTLRIRKHFTGLVYIFYFISFILFATMTGISLDGAGLPDLFNLLITAIGGASGIGIARALLPLWVKRQKEKLKKITHSIVRILSDSNTMASSAELSGGQIHLPGDEELTTDRSTVRHQTRS